MNNYLCNEIIGKGTFSEVLKVTHKETKEQYAIKKINIESFKRFEDKFREEINIIKKLKHENILQYLESYRSKRHYYILTELCDGTITNKIDSMNTEKDIHFYYIQIINGIKYLYNNNILHRDLKPENILLKGNIVKIADFGFAKEVNNINNMMMTQCGTPLYMAPEVILGNEYNSKSDIWSLGIILYQMMYKKHPFIANNLFKLINCYKNKQIDFPQYNYSNELIELIKNMLIYDVNERISWDNLFNNKWINKKWNLSDSFILGNDNILLYDSMCSINTDSSISLNYTESSCSSISDYDSYEDKYKNDVNVKTRPIQISKNKNNQVNDSIPETCSLKIGKKEVYMNENHFSKIEEITTNNTFPNIIDNDKGGLLDFVKRSLNFFSL